MKNMCGGLLVRLSSWSKLQGHFSSPFIADRGIFGQQSHQIRNYLSQNTSLSLASNPNKTQNPSRKYVIKTPDMSLSGISRFAILSLRTLLVCTNETGLYQCHCREIKNGCNLEIIIFSQSDREHFLDLDALYPL